jgi:hypothetical protein
MLDFAPLKAPLTGASAIFKADGGVASSRSSLVPDSRASITSSIRKSPKLKSPGMRFVTQGADELSPVESGNRASPWLRGRGMANAWGAGLYRFTVEDLAGYPIDLGTSNLLRAITAKVG